MNKRQYSYSRLDLYDRCPHAYKTVYLDGIPRARNEARERGQILHGMVADYLNRLITLGLATDWDWARTAAPQGAMDDVAEIWERFYEGFVLPSGLEAPGVERRLAVDRMWRPVKFDSKRARFRMVLDFHFRQNGLGVIVDWKTSREVPQDVAKDLQLRTYGWGLKQTLYQDIEEVLLRLHFLRYGKEREVFLMPQDLAEVPDELDDRIGVIEKDKTFDPIPGSFCGMCGITSHCPVMAQAVVPIEVMAPASREEAEKAASMLMTLQKMEKELTARLKEWVRENGAIKVGDMVYGASQVVSYDLDPQKVTTMLLEAGLSREEIWPLVSMTKTNLEKGLRKLKRRDLLEPVLSTAAIKNTEKIDFRKGNS